MSLVRFTIIIPTSGRPTLTRTLNSIMMGGSVRGDEVLVIGDGEQPAARRITEGFKGRLRIRYLETPKATFPGDAGDTQRNAGMPLAKGTHLLFQDDDDAYTPGALSTIRGVAAVHPERILIFRMKAVNLERHTWGTLWHYQGPEALFIGNVSTQMFVVPNVPGQLGTWRGRDGGLGGGDFHFIQTTVARWPGGKESVLWREELICDRF